MAINKKLIHFLTKTNFLNKLEAGEILDTSIVFIRDAKQIWTHGELYSCPYTEEEINLLFIGSNVKLTGYAETYSPIEILATDTVNQAFGKIEDYLTDIDQLNAVLVDTGDAAFDPIINDYISSTQLANELLKYVTDLKLASKGYITAAQVPNPDLSNYITKVDSQNYTDTAIANLVDSAPETLNTLNELAAAISDHLDVTDVLDAAISNKADKAEIPTKVSQLENDVPYALKSDIEVEVEVEVENGVYALTLNNKLVTYNVADSNCIGCVVVYDEQKFMIEPTEVYDPEYDSFAWSHESVDTAITNYTTVEGSASSCLVHDDGYNKHLSNNPSDWVNGAISDKNGKNNTKILINASQEGRNIGTVIKKFNSGEYGDNSGFSDWYLPSCNQYALIALWYNLISSMLTKIGNKSISSNAYWTSTEKAANSAYIMYSIPYTVARIAADLPKSNNLRIRLIRDIEIKKSLKEKVSELESSVSEIELNYFKWSKLELLKNRGSLSLVLSAAASPDAIPYTLSINFEYPVESDITINYTSTDPFGLYRGDGTLVCKKGETLASKIEYGTEDVSDFDFVFNSFSPTEDDVYKYEIIFG